MQQLAEQKLRINRIIDDENKLSSILPSLLSIENTKKSQLQTPTVKQLNKKNNVSQRSKQKLTNENTIIAYIAESMKIKSARRNQTEEKQNQIPPKIQSMSRPNHKMSFEDDRDKFVNFKIKQCKVYRPQRIQLITKDIEIPLPDKQLSMQLQLLPIKIPNTAQHKKNLIAFSPFLFTIANKAYIKNFSQSHKIKDKLFIINISLFIGNERNFWAPEQKLKTETKSILNVLSTHGSIILMYNNETEINIWSSKIQDLKLDILCSIFLRKQKYSKLYDLTDIINYLNLNSSKNIYIIDPIYDQCDPKSIYEQKSLPLVSKVPTNLFLLFINITKKTEIMKLIQFLNTEEKLLTIPHSNCQYIHSTDLINFKEFITEYTDILLFNEVSMLKFKNNSEARIKTVHSNALEIFKDKLNKYMKILQNETNPQQKLGFSSTYIVGDLIKRNYNIYKQITSNKYFTKVKHEKILSEIQQLIVKPDIQQCSYKVPIYLLFG